MVKKWNFTLVVRTTIMISWRLLPVHYLNIFLLHVLSKCSVAIVIRRTFQSDHQHIRRAVPANLKFISLINAIFVALFALRLRILVWLYHFLDFNYVVSCVSSRSLAIFLGHSCKFISLSLRAHPEVTDLALVSVIEITNGTFVWLEKDSLLAVRRRRYYCLTSVMLSFKARNSLTLIVLSSFAFLWRSWLLVDSKSLFLRSTCRADNLRQAHVRLWKSWLMPTCHSVFFLNARSARKTISNLPPIYW